MPKLEPKDVQKELDQGWIWPVYWLYGGERMKARELLKRIRKAVVPAGAPGMVAEGALGGAAGFGAFNEETLEGAETTATAIVESAQSLSLGGGTRFIVVRDAHAVKESESLAPLLGPRAKGAELPHVVVFLAKDLDGRKKFSKQLAEKAAVVSCEEIEDAEREPWIGYLAKRKGLSLGPAQVVALRSLDPWSLDIVDQELEKLSIAMAGGDDPEAAAALLAGVGSLASGEAFLEAFFRRDLRTALTQLEAFADQPDESLPLLGLLAWNARHLAIVAADRAHQTRNAKLSPFLADRFARWARAWTLEDAIALQSALAEVDFQIKQTARLAIGIWTNLVTRFCEDP
jgi:DNA polymerase III delta subunit